MEKIYNTYKPNGFHTVNPYLFVDNPEKLIDFLKEAFYAKELNRTLSANGEIANVILQIGDSSFMISKAIGEFLNMKTSLYLFVQDVDFMHQRAVSYGAKVSFEPSDMPYGDRQSGVIDPSGNYWWLSKRLDEKNYHS